jgi:hypothetical protein
MDPAAYKQMRGLMKDQIPQAPVHEMPQEQALNPTSGQSKPADTDWTVYNMDVSRGNLNQPEDPDDPRMYVGWREDATNYSRGDKAMPWMSNTHLQPFMSPMWGADMEDKTDEEA